MNSTVKLAISTGEPAGIGPEVSIAAANAFIADNPHTKITLYGDRSLFQSQSLASQIQIAHIPLIKPNQIGRLNPENAPYVLSVIQESSEACRSGVHDALITAPVQKSILSRPSIEFSGHTEFLAQLDGKDQVVMMLCGEISDPKSEDKKPFSLRVALASTHLPIQQVAQSIQYKSLLQTIRIIHSDLQTRFGIASPIIMVTGLNPHAGEDGHLGREEIDTIIPAIKAAQVEGIKISGPFPADTLFNPARLQAADAVLAMYHDQGLAPFKFATFTEGVNVTLGLSYIRTSVDHGTALDIAGHDKADWHSMYAALNLAQELTLRQKRFNASGT
ncbi:MAG: 4-hydroxythreonine-4-phosphate dehydrogenase PdxA [Burkholderiaceae bacterium]|jgi:4-hydroxythreonine-4-phosphate dehydrogenase|nr:4-hydroxythreonine-4-phosphate dehydrogenase PdxA [Burkholderiaceae bacterium]